MQLFTNGMKPMQKIQINKLIHIHSTSFCDSAMVCQSCRKQLSLSASFVTLINLSSETFLMIWSTKCSINIIFMCTWAFCFSELQTSNTSEHSGKLFLMVLLNVMYIGQKSYSHLTTSGFSVECEYKLMEYSPGSINPAADGGIHQL